MRVTNRSGGNGRDGRPTGRLPLLLVLIALLFLAFAPAPGGADVPVSGPTEVHAIGPDREGGKTFLELIAECATHPAACSTALAPASAFARETRPWAARPHRTAVRPSGLVPERTPPPPRVLR